MDFKEVFANYLEETASEIRAFSLNKTFIEDVFLSLREASKDFYIKALEESTLRPIK